MVKMNLIYLFIFKWKQGFTKHLFQNNDYRIGYFSCLGAMMPKCLQALIAETTYVLGPYHITANFLHFMITVRWIKNEQWFEKQKENEKKIHGDGWNFT